MTVLSSLAQADAHDPRAVLRKNFERKAAEIVDSVDGVFGVVVKDLKTGETFAINDGVAFTQASAIKVQVLVELYRQAAEGEIDLHEVLTLNGSDMVAGAGILRHLSGGKVAMTVRDLAVMMIVLSDNTATNILIDLVGMDKVNTTMEDLGMAETRLQRKMMDRQARLEDRENIASPRDAARLLELVHRREIINEASCADIISILALPKDGRISRHLPQGTTVANKTGSVTGVVTDIGIVELPGRPFIVAGMINWHNDRDAAEEAIAAVSRLAYDYFDRLENSNRYGHRK